jgi:hypothetical protein
MQTDSRPFPRPRRRLGLRALLLLCALGAAVALAACGSSGSGSTSSTASASTSKAAGPSAGSGRFASLRSCLQKQGITLPTPPSGSGRPGAPGGAGRPGGSGGAGGPGFFGGARRRLQLPAGVSQAKFQEALKKCGAVRFRGRGSANLSSATVRAALNSYAACLRSNGINVPAPNTSGNGPIFNTKGINTSSTQFKTAQSKCRGDLKGAFGGGPGGQPGAAAPGSPPPAGAQGAPPSEGTAG